MDTTKNTIELDCDILPETRGVFALRVKGHNMTDAHILDGDIVILSAASEIENGDMAAVYIKSQQVSMLRHYFREGDRVRLQPASADAEPTFVNPGDLTIMGRAISVIRHI